MKSLKALKVVVDVDHPTLPGVDEGLVASEQLVEVRRLFELPEGAPVPQALRDALPHLIAVSERFQALSGALGRVLDAARLCPAGCPCAVHAVLADKNV